MGLDKREQQLQCPCCKACKDCTDFQKIVDLKDAGIVIYRHTTRTEDVNKETGLLETATNTTEDVFILHNNKDVQLKSADFVPALEPNKISCPRCRRIIEHAQKLLRKVPTIEKKDILGVCNHCRNKERSRSPCYECEEFVQKIVTSKGDRSEDTKQRVKLWLSKIKHLLQDVRTEENESRKIKGRTHSGSYIDRLRLDTPRPVQEPVVKQLFHPETQRSNVSETVPDLMENIERIFDTRSQEPYLQKLDKSIIFVDSIKYPEKFMSSIEAASTIESAMVRPSDEATIIFDANNYMGRQPRPEKYRQEKERIRMAPFQEFRDDASNLERPDIERASSLERSMKNTGSIGIKSDTLKQFGKLHKVTLKDDLATKRENKYQQANLAPSIRSSEEYEKNILLKDPELELKKTTKPSMLQYHRDESPMPQSYHGRTKTAKERKEPERGIKSSSRITKYRSEETLLTSVVGVNEDLLKKDFSYFFPKEIIATIKPKRLISSAELIKDTQDMLLAKAEEERMKFEEERKKKLEEEENKKIARDEKKTLAEEKRKADDEKRKLEEERRKVEDAKDILEGGKNKEVQQILQNEDKNKQIKETKGITEKKMKATSSVKESTIKSRSEKSKDSKPKREPKQKIEKETLKADKEAEKALKEEERKEKEEKTKIQKGEKQKEKEENKKVQKAEKQKEKEGKERVENEKKEQSRDEKYKKQKEKDVVEQQDNKKKEGKPRDQNQEHQDKISKEQTKGKDGAADDELRKLLAEQAKQKEEELKRKKQQEQSEKLARNAADGKAKESEELKQKSGKEAKANIKPELESEITKQKLKTDKPTTRELNINKIKVRKASGDDLILDLVELKQSGPHTERIRPNRLSELDLSPVIIEEHKRHKSKKDTTCLLCIDSELELDVESIVFKTDKGQEMADIIIGQKIFRYKPPLVQRKEDEGVVPIKFQSVFNGDAPVVKNKETVEFTPKEPDPKHVLPSTKSGKITFQEPPKGIVRYALSDRTFIDKGWTLLPTEKVVRKMNVYRMRPAHPEFDWFEHNKNKRLMLYDTGEKLAEFDDNGRGRWYYRNGRLALDYYDAEEINAQQRFVVYSSGEPDERGRTPPNTILATFDYLGNGIVFDYGGKIRLKYNQTEGVVLDRGIGPVSHWKWHTLNDPPVLQQVMIDTQMAHKDPEILKMGGPSDNKTRPDNEEMLAIEFDNFIKEKSKKLSQTFKPFQIKMKALKINEHFSLKILDQATVYLIYRDGTTNLKLNIGMILDHKEIVDTDTAELGDVSSNLERFPARTESLAGLQRSVAYAQRFERSRTERERRLHPAGPCASADQLAAAASRPLRPPMLTLPSGSSVATRYCFCKCSRKPSSSNLYYDNRLI